MSVLVRSSTSTWLRRIVGGIVFALVAAAGVTACGGIGITSEGPGGDTATAGSAGDPRNDGALPSANLDASTAAADAGPSQGAGPTADGGLEAPDTQPYISPLCGSITACDPDLVSSNGCGPSAGDGGGTRNADAGYPYGSDGATSSACRVSTTGRTSSTVRASACVTEGAGTDGSACAGGDDCSAGFECAGSPGQCRRYCCAGSCSEAKTFCDVQPASGANAISVPVCMPVDQCKLLDAMSCSPGETCSVVADDGTTSCVAVGAASEGETCDTVHCMAGEICVGKSGSRVCDKLCHVSGTDCSAGKTCTTNATLFEEDQTVGVCTAAP